MVTISLRTKVYALLCILLITGACEKEPEPVNQPPTAKIMASVSKGESPLVVEFDGSLSTDPEEGNLTFNWDFGDGTGSSSMAPSKTYSEDGSYSVKLSVKDEGGLEASDQKTIEVDTPPNLFPITENAQWVYLVKSTETENGNVSGYEEGYTYLTVKELNLEYEYSDYMTLRVTGKKFYNEKKLADFIYLSHTRGKKLAVKHDIKENYSNMIDLQNSSWNNFAMFFSRRNSQSVTLSSSNISIGLGDFPVYEVRYHRDNWGEQYVSERFDVTETEYLNPQIGLSYRSTSRYVNFRDCFTCPVYGGSTEIELVGYYIPQADGTVLEAGYGYNPNNPYGGNLGLLTIWASVDIGYTEVNIDGEYVGMITNYWSSGLECDQESALNVSRPDGSYTLTAESPKGYYWEGTITFIEGVCDTIELLLSKKGTGGSGSISAR